MLQNRRELFYVAFKKVVERFQPVEVLAFPNCCEFDSVISISKPQKYVQQVWTGW